MKLEYAMIGTFVASLVFTYLSRPVAFKLKIIDSPTALKIHDAMIARFGGLGIFIAVAIGTLLLSHTYVALLVGSAVIWCVGAIDDRWTISSKQKLAGQALAGVVLWYLIFSANPGISGLRYGFIGFLLAVLFSNAVNLIDGMNGLAGGNVFLIALGLASLGLLHGQAVGLPLIVAAATLGFLPFNFPKARLFMGDSGSLLLGYLIAYMLVQLLRNSPVLFVCGLVIATLPVFDLSLGILRRFLCRRPIFSADRGHFYDHLAVMTNGNVTTVLITYAMTASLIVIACALSFTTATIALASYVLIVVALLAMSGTLGWLRTSCVQGGS